MTTLVINPELNVLVGADLGRRERERLGLDQIDETDEPTVVKIDTAAILSDFIHALIGPSVRKLGFDRFAAKYQFDAAPGVRQNILETARLDALGGGGAVGP
jgi:hypothetical protein